MPDPTAEQTTRLVCLVQHGESEPKSRDPQRHLVRFQNGGLVGLIRKEEKCTVACLLPPELAMV